MPKDKRKQGGQLELLYPRAAPVTDPPSPLGLPLLSVLALRVVGKRGPLSHCPAPLRPQAKRGSASQQRRSG
jgi:hypothetical protein